MAEGGSNDKGNYHAAIETVKTVVKTIPEAMKNADLQQASGPGTQQKMWDSEQADP